MAINFVIDLAIFVVGAISTTNVIEYVVFVIEIGFYFFLCCSTKFLIGGISEILFFFVCI